PQLDTDVADILYTSGTTGRPKGTVHTHAGFLVKTARDMHFDFEVTPGDDFWWLTDLGWIMGPWQLIGSHALGSTVHSYTGGSNPAKLLGIVEEEEIDRWGISPSAARKMREEEPGQRFELGSLEVVGSTGEPLDRDSWYWMKEDLGEKELPVINVSGGTELGGHVLSPSPIERIKPTTVGKPILGVPASIKPYSGGERGSLVIEGSFPSLTDGLWKDRERYLDYWEGET
ncbi:MAG: AMP-binding protein, partial [Candidatus Nanohaloarchaea archaeon]